MAIALASVAFRLLCLALGCSLSSLFAVVAAAEGAIPRVALLFITRAHMPLERVWHEFFRSVEGLRPPALSASQLADVMEDKRVLDVEQKLRNVGSFSQNTLLRDQDCVDNAIILELFSVYVHASPGFQGFNQSSVFHGREIEPSIEAERFTHSLGKLTLLLLEAALYDTQVANARFVVVSDSEAPLYNAAAIYMQLMRSHRSRVGEVRTYVEHLSTDLEYGAASPLMFVPPFTRGHLKKHSQWVSLTRATAFAAVHDRVVEPWFATFSEPRWRCRFVAEGLRLLPAAARLLHESGVDVRTYGVRGRGALVLRRHNLLPRDYTAGEYYDGLLPQPRSAGAASGRWGQPYGAEGVAPVGVPVWASELRAMLVRWWRGAAHSPGSGGGGVGGGAGGSGGGLQPPGKLTFAQRQSLQEYRHTCHVRAPTWAYLPFNLGQTEKRLREATWGPFSGVGVSSPESGGGHWGPAQKFGWDAEQRANLNSFANLNSSVVDGTKLLEAAAEDSDSGATSRYVWDPSHDTASSLDPFNLGTQHLVGGHSTGEFSTVLVRNGFPFYGASRRHRRPEEKPEAEKSIWELLDTAVRLEEREERVYNLAWPFPYCQDCGTDVRAQAWEAWGVEVQYQFLRALTPAAAARVSYSVSDECLVPSILSLYGLSGPLWQTNGPSSHVDWKRQTNGHPGTYSRVMLWRGANVVRRDVYRATRAFFAAGEMGSVTDGGTRGGSSAQSSTGAEGHWAAPPTEGVLPEECPLFGRKFQADIAHETNSWFVACRYIGLHRHCIEEA